MHITQNYELRSKGVHENKGSNGERTILWTAGRARASWARETASTIVRLNAESMPLARADSEFFWCLTA